MNSIRGEAVAFDTKKSRNSCQQFSEQAHTGSFSTLVTAMNLRIFTLSERIRP